MTTLRDRYSAQITDVTGSLNPHRIKLTPARVAAMKEALRETLRLRARFTGNYRATRQARAAAAFAAWAIRSGHRVSRVTFPDGPRGSVYVRVAGKVVRFSDHESTYEAWNRSDVGGYSKRLGRRHRPADASICTRRRFTFDAARAALETAR